MTIFNFDPDPLTGGDLLYGEGVHKGEGSLEGIPIWSEAAIIEIPVGVKIAIREFSERADFYLSFDGGPAVLAHDGIKNIVEVSPYIHT